MKELEYPFNAEKIITKKKSIKRELLKKSDNDFIEKKSVMKRGL